MTDFPSWALPPHWDESCGTIRNVWDDKVKTGTACLWSDAWLGGPIALGYVIEEMDIPSLWAELRDQSNRGSAVASAIALATSSDPSDKCWSRYLKDARQVVRAGRVAYQDYSAPWALGERTRVLKWRPGWEPAPLLSEFKRYRDGTWHWVSPEGEDITLSDAYIAQAPSIAEERQAEQAVHDAVRKKMSRGIR